MICGSMGKNSILLSSQNKDYVYLYFIYRLSTIPDYNFNDENIEIYTIIRNIYYNTFQMSIYSR